MALYPEGAEDSARGKPTFPALPDVWIKPRDSKGLG